MAFITVAQDAMLKDRSKWGTVLDAAEVLGGDGKPNVGLRLGWHPKGQMRLVKANGKDVKNKKVKATPKANGKGLSFAIGSSLEILEEPSITFPDGTLWTPERGITRVNVILDKKPTTPSWDFELDLPAGAQLDYQPALTPEEVDFGQFRPEWCVGSYTLCVGGFKLGHFPRPFAVDANGAWTWGTLTIWQEPTGQWKLRKAIEAAWLATAKYPVLVDDTFGYTSVAGSTVSWLYDRVYCDAYNAPASSGTIDTFHMYCQEDAGGDTSKRITLGLYDSTPATKIADSAEGNPPAAFDWVVCNKNGTPSVTAATNYWLAFNSNNTGINFGGKYDSSGGSGVRYRNQTYQAGALSNLASYTTIANWRLSIYVTYTPAAAGQPTIKRFGGVPFVCRMGGAGGTQGVQIW